MNKFICQKWYIKLLMILLIIFMLSSFVMPQNVLAIQIATGGYYSLFDVEQYLWNNGDMYATEKLQEKIKNELGITKEQAVAVYNYVKEEENKEKIKFCLIKEAGRIKICA